MIRALSLLMLGFSLEACTTGGSSASNSLLAPSAAITTETFAGTVDVGSGDSHTFSVAQSGGQLNVTLTAAGPPSTIYMGIGVGTPSGASCALLTSAQVLTQAGTTAQLSGTVNAGTYCVQVFDAGNQTSQVSYAVTVTHY